MTTQIVTPAQVLAAQLTVELEIEDGEVPDAAVVAIANAKPVQPVAESPSVTDTTALQNDRLAQTILRAYPGLSTRASSTMAREMQRLIREAIEAGSEIAVVRRVEEGDVVEVVDLQLGSLAESLATTKEDSAPIEPKRTGS